MIVDGQPLVVPGVIITPAWPNYGGNLNQVPAVANGKVYVASNQAAADLRPETGRELEVVEIAGARRLPSRSFQRALVDFSRRGNDRGRIAHSAKHLQSTCKQRAVKCLRRGATQNIHDCSNPQPPGENCRTCAASWIYWFLGQGNAYPVEQGERKATGERGQSLGRASIG